MVKIKTADKAKHIEYKSKINESRLERGGKQRGIDCCRCSKISYSSQFLNVIRCTHFFQYRIYHGTRKVRVDNKTIYAFRTDLPVQPSKLY